MLNKLILIVFCLVAFSVNAESLRVTNVQFIENNKRLSQVLISFNQPIAQYGEVPTTNQIASVQLTQNIKRHCHWRYQGNNKLSCDTLIETPSYLPLNIKITKQFRGIDKKVENEFESKWINKRFAFEQQTINEQTLSIVLNTPFESDQRAAQAMIGKIQFSVSGNKVASSSSRYTVSDNGQTMLDFTFSKPIKPENIKAIIPKGFKASSSHSETEQDIVIIKAPNLPTSPAFLGLYCQTEHNGWRKEHYKPIPDGVDATCPPESIAFGFTHPLKHRLDLSAIVEGSFETPPITIKNTFVDTGPYLYNVALRGDTAYEFNLSNITSEKGEYFDNVGKLITFRTGKESSHWRTQDYLGTQFTSSENAYIPFYHKNAVDLEIRYFSVQDTKQLLQWLNGKNKSNIQTSFDVKTHNDNKLHITKLPVSHLLNNTSGAVFFSISGTSTAAPYTSDSDKKSKEVISTVSDFELKAFTNSRLFVKANDFKTSSPIQSEVSLICEGMKNPTFIGRTSKKGELHLSRDTWSDLVKSNRDNCWLWAQSINQKAMLKLDINDQTKVQGKVVFSQPIYKPNSPIDFSLLAKRHTEQGLVTIKGDIKLTLHKVGNKTFKPIILEAKSVSEFGVHQYSLPTGLQNEGYYRIEASSNSLQIKVSDYITISEFIPPEVEFSYSHPASVGNLELLKIKVTGKTYNGFKAKDFSGALSYKYSSMYSTPKGWPLDYKYSDSREVTRAIRTHQKTTLKLSDDIGEFKLELAPNLPLTKIDLNSTVTSESGESHFYRTSLPYFSREHFIGTKQTNHVLSIIALEKAGKQIATDATVYLALEDDKKLALCAGTTPFNCDIPLAHTGRLTFEIESENGRYTWTRTHNVYSNEPSTNPAKASLTLKGQNQATVGSTYKLNVHSDFAGKATIFINAGEYQEITSAKLSEGENIISLDISEKHLPGFTANIYMPFNIQQRSEIKNLNAEEVNELFEKLTEQFEFIPASQNNFSLPKKRSMLGTFASIKVDVTHSKKLELSVAHQTNAKPNSNLSITLNSNQDSDVQLWLVNDALYDMTFKRTSDVSFDELYDSYSYKLPFNHFYNLTKWSVNQDALKSPELFNYFHSHNNTYQTRYRSAYAPAAPPPNGSRTVMEQSVWLDTVSVREGTAKSLNIQLPQLIGRWRLFALAASENNHARYEGVINTSSAIEYSLYVPPKIFDKDRAYARLVATNRTDRITKDKIDIKIGSETTQVYQLDLQPNERNSFNIALSELPLGKHQIYIESSTDSSYNQTAKFEVIDSNYTFERSVKVDASSTQTVVIPSNERVTKSHVIPANKLSPDWHGLLNYHNKYPHQCWEQTLSRAVSLNDNPVSKIDNNTVKTLLRSGSSQNSSSYGYSYFSNTKTDAFLTAYTLLSHYWLEGSQYQFKVDQTLVERLKQELLSAPNYTPNVASTLSMHSKGWLLWALAERGDISLENVKYIRSQGIIDTKSNLFQLLALKAAGEDQDSIENALLRILDSKFQDNSFASIGPTDSQCLAIMLTEKQPLRDDIAKLVVAKQLATGHFGNTLNDALCTRALKNRTGTTPSFAELAPKVLNDFVTEYKINTNIRGDYYLRMTASRSFEADTASFGGIGITKSYQTLQENEWVTTELNEIKVGQLVKVKLVVFSPIEREHVIVIDRLPNALVAVNPIHRNKQYTHWIGERALSSQPMTEAMQKVVWHRYKLEQGHTLFEYLAEARFSGVYISPSAKVELMYTPEIYGSSGATALEAH
ncbi:hypothetical protein [Pseudoalteromonas luteoviolacea]|uniref:alpha-2-macroglobulin family protein n=1 Tax=Pseudoalteromonas luteoviolacea TaxID=43657 RepID=UPI001154B1C3|nr:hypothetical protein [Pseudoalteromonas luteoviolacea]TQF67332.1 hypothetical protein FLM44_19275 [Pseudoalteromonas luteoviolacea]